MKNVSIFFLLLTILLAFGACKKDGQYSFIDQDLQGKILGDSWTYTGGKASLANGGDLSINIVGEALDTSDICLATITGDQVLFFVDAATGLYQLGITSQTITLLDFETFFNNIATKGALEIVSLDATAGGLVVGKIDARIDDDNYVNGNFTVEFCP